MLSGAFINGIIRAFDIGSYNRKIINICSDYDSIKSDFEKIFGSYNI